MTTKCTLQEPIALVAIACEFAGDIHSPTDLWNTLEQHRDVGSAIPRDRMDLQSHCAHMFNQDKDEHLKKHLVRAGYFLSNSLWDSFEPSFFGLSNSEATSIDPAHRLLMMKFVHLLDDAGYTIEKMYGSRTSVHIGQFSTDHALNTFRLKSEQRTRLQGPNSMLYNAAARLSYHFNMHGPNVSLDVACSSSLEAVHLAVQCLRTGESDMAVCGGVNAVYAPENILSGSLIGAQSPDGRSRSFSVDANGYAKGEGLGLVLLKRLSDAERDGDKIYCVIRDVLSHHDGNDDKSNFVIPSGLGQKRLLAEVYERSETNPDRIFYVEAHGTGTPVGDPIEANALGQFFHRSPSNPPLLIGSIKSNLGHTEGAAGIASLIKIAMCMRHRIIPPNMHFKALNPKIEAQRYNLHVIQHYVPFPPASNDTVLIGINSFGMGGNTTHAIIDEYRSKQSNLTNNIDHNQNQKEKSDIKQQFLFLITAKNHQSLLKQVAQFNIWFQNVFEKIHNDPDRFLARISKQLLLKRTISYDHLAIFVAADRAQLQTQVDAFLAEQTSPGILITTRPTLTWRKICFVYSGQGPQWWAMGRQLYKAEPLFRQWVDRIDSELSKVNKGEWRLLDELIGKNNESESRINDTSIAQPALFAIQVALTALLVSWQIFPHSIVSHSAGEQAAAFVSGRVTLQEAVRIVYHRGYLQNRNTRQGGRMLAVSMSEQQVKNELLKGIEDRACIAVVNSPRSVTISGEESTIDELQQILTALHPNVFKARLRIENAFHSHQMDRFDIEKDMHRTLGDIPGLPLSDPQQMFNPRCAQARLYSSVLGGIVDDRTPLNAHHWWANVRHSVRFNEAMTAIIQDKAADIFLEISPHPVLATSIGECCENNGLKSLILPTLKRKEDEQTTLLTSIAQLTPSSIVWQHYLQSRIVQSTDDDNELFETFPLYTFNVSPCWYESKEAVIERLAYRLPSHPLLGVRQWTGQTNASWRSLININLSEHAYLKDHKIQDAILFPATGYIELAVAACRQLLSPNENTQSGIVFENVEFISTLVLTEHELTEIFTHIVMPMREWCIYSRPWTSAGQDCTRSSGMSGTDVLKSFDDLQLLNQYSLSEYTLHARGQINLGGAKQQLPLLTDQTVPRELCSELDPNNVYAHLLSRGYQYGPTCRLTKSLHSTRKAVEAEIDCSQYSAKDLHAYSLIHPAAFDACLHPALALLPGTFTTFIPVGIQRVTIPGETTFNSAIQMRATYHESIHGLAKQRTYEFDCIIESADTAAVKPLVTFDRCIIQQVQGIQSGRWAADKSIFEKMNILVDLPNRDLTAYLDTIMHDYCLKTKWTENLIEASVVDLLPSPKNIMTSNIDSTGDEDLNESIEPLTELAVYYAQMALEESNLDSVQEQQALLVAVRSLVSQSKVKPTFHSTQLYLVQLFNRFPRLKPIVTVLATCGKQLKEVLAGERDGLEVLTANEEIELALEQMQSLISTRQTLLIFNLLTRYLRENHGKSLAGRKLRIFWLGGSSGLDFFPVLQFLIDICRETDLLIDITYTNPNSTALAKVEKTVNEHLADQNRVHVTYDDAFDLYNTEQNDKTIVESYDIVFAANKLQGSQDITMSLITVRRLLVPNGLLLALELTHAPLYFDLIYGLFDQWWSLTDDHRALLKSQQWTTTIQQISGFETVEIMPSSFGNALIIAQKTVSLSILPTLEERQHQAWLLLVDDSKPNIGDALAPLLPSSNITMIHQLELNDEQICSKIEQMMKAYKQLYIVFAWPLNQTLIVDDSEKAFEQHEKHICVTLIRILQSIQVAEPRSSPFVFVVTKNSQPGAGNNLNPSGSPLIGLTRSLTLEYERHRLKLIDLQSSSSPAELPTLMHTLAQHLIKSQYATDLDEIALHYNKETDSIKRLEWHYEMLQEEQKTKNESESKQVSIIPKKDADQHPFHLRIAPSRFLDDLTWVHDTKVDELSENMVEIRIHCVGVNFRDILKSRGLYPYMRPFAQFDKEQPLVDRDTELGLDFVGTVLRCHANNKVKSGDRVVGMSWRGMFHSHRHVDIREVVRIPNEGHQFTEEQLAAMPNACVTVLYSLKYRVNLRPGQTVLVHAATGGTGQACIQYCQSVGARVFATAGSEEKRRFLREHYGIENVFNSRDLSFVQGIRTILPDGIDVVVNSLSGALLQESIKLLSSQGHFVEWGKRDVFDKSHLSMFDFRNDCSFHVIDVSSLVIQQPDLFGRILEEVVQLITQGVFKPIDPTNVYEPSKIIEVFKLCNSGQVIGKCIIRLTSSEQPLALNDQQMASGIEGENTMFSFDVCHRGTILISGGCGGVGLTMSRWMIEERGVKRLMLMSRRPLAQIEQPSNPEYEEWLRLRQAKKKHDAHIDVVQADVTKFEDVRNLIEQLASTSYPVRGIIHGAVVEEDRSLAKLSRENLIKVLGAKAHGAWNLHRASQLPGASVHFFLLFSSIRNHLIYLASGGYNAGNQFLDILARYRAEHDLPALSISLPAVSGAGMFHRNRDMLLGLQRITGFELVPTIGVFELIERFHVDQMKSPCPIIFAANWQKLNEDRNILVTEQLRKIVIRQHAATSNLETSTGSSKQSGVSGSMNNSLESTIEQTQRTVARLLGASSFDQISIDRSLISQGMDSLAAVSLYNWLGQETNIFIPLSDLLQGFSIQMIAEHVYKKLNTEKQTDVTSNEDVLDSYLESMAENQTEILTSLHYTGTDNIVCVRRPIHGKSPIFFCILPNFTTNDSSLLEARVDKLFENHDKVPPAGIYAFQMPQLSASKDVGKNAREIISQMRRIQPQGPHALLATNDDQGESLTREIMKELKTHSLDCVVQLFSK